MGNVKNVTIENFAQEVLQSDKPVLLKFWAEWCRPCMMIAPIINNIADERKDSLKVVSINIAEASKIAEEHGVRGIPTLILLKNGNIMASLMGYYTKDKLDKFLDQHTRAREDSNL